MSGMPRAAEAPPIVVEQSIVDQLRGSHNFDADVFRELVQARSPWIKKPPPIAARDQNYQYHLMAAAMPFEQPGAPGFEGAECKSFSNVAYLQRQPQIMNVHGASYPSQMMVSREGVVHYSSYRPTVAALPPNIQPMHLQDDEPGAAIANGNSRSWNLASFGREGCMDRDNEIACSSSGPEGSVRSFAR